MAVEAAPSAQIDDHLGCSEHTSKGCNNGPSSRTLQRAHGEVEIETPQARNGQTRTTHFDAQIKMSLCLVPGMRNALKFVSRKDRKVGTTDLKKIDRALMAEDVEQELLTRTEIRDRKYPTLGQSRTRYWLNLITLFDDSEDIRKVMHTTDVIDKRYFQRCVDYYSSWGAKATFFGERDCFG